jgi:hypothetical protein
LLLLNGWIKHEKINQTLLEWKPLA